MKYLLIFLIYSTAVFGRDVIYRGTLSFQSKTNIPRVSIKATTSEFEKLYAIFTDKTDIISTIEIIVDVAKFKTGLIISNHQVYEQNISWLLKKPEPVFFKMKMERIVCFKQKKSKDYACNGLADFLAGKAGFQRQVNFILDQNKNAKIRLVLSRKDIGLPTPKKLGFEIDDKVEIHLDVQKT